MKTLDKNSKTMQWISDTDYSAEDIQTFTTQQDEELDVSEQKSLLFQMYELEEEDLFI